MSLTTHARALPALLALVSPGLLLGQGPQSASNHRPDVHPTPAKVVSAVTVDPGAIQVDGQLDESAWRTAAAAEDFTQQSPNEGQPASQRTVVRFLVSSDALYIGARMYDELGRRGVVSRLVRRDASAESDELTIILDTFHDHLGQTLFRINPAGVRRDAYGPAGAFTDYSWDPVWEAKTAIDSLGWTAELRVPLAQLRYGADTVQTWGLQIERSVNRLNERAMWAFWGLNESGGPTYFGHLTGVRVQRAPGRAEFQPYVVGRSTNSPPPDPADPFKDSHALDYRFGADFKYLLTSNLTVSGTINPDFGQVEVDPAVVNLSAFETFFEEKRPFFIEGRGLFRFGSLWCFFCSNTSSLSLFHSRRIGRTPQGADLAQDAGDFADVPENTTIIGAAKITGQTPGKWSIGALNAVTGRERAAVQPPGGGRIGVDVEPFTNYFVGRLAKDLRDGNWQVAGFATSVIRSLDDGSLRARLHRHAESFGLAQELWLAQRKYFIMTQLAVSQVAGEPSAILRAQQSSARYFQRPDRQAGVNGLFTDRLDSTLTAMRGFGGYARIAKESGEWRWELSTNFRSPGFETNDIGFLTRADYWWMNANLHRAFNKPTSWYRSIGFTVGGQQQYNFDGDLNDRQFHTSIGITFPNYWGAFTFWIHRPSLLDERLTRGGPVVRSPHSNFNYFNLSTDSRKSISADFNLDRGCDGDGMCDISGNVGLTLRPVSNIQLSLSPSVSRNRTAQQYVTAVDDPTATAFYGRRYVFAELEQRSVSMNTRLNLTFTPDLTLEVFAQPFISSGRYTRFKEFVTPRERGKTIYGEDAGSIVSTPDGYTVEPDGAGPAAAFDLDDPDFNFRSLRGNAVLRWEFVPGSTLYLVWTQDRSDVASVGNLDFNRDVDALLAAPAENIFLVKLNYWLGF
jgi:hypothetical protein